MKTLCSLLLASASLSPLLGVTTHVAEQHDFATLSAGELENVSISNLGEVRLAPSLAKLTTLEESIVWDAVADAQANLYVGTGKDGTVYKITPSGESETIFQPVEILSRGLCLDAEGNLYVATSPEGRVYRIPPGGRPEIYFDPSEEYIWDMAFDAEGNLYVATGKDGKIYKLKPDFKPGDEAELWFESDRTHITTIVFDSSGDLLAGTAPKAYLYRISPEGKGSVIYNAGTDEISAIVPGDDKNVYFTTLHYKEKGKSSNKEDETAMDLPTVLEKLYGDSQQESSNGNGKPESKDTDEPIAATAPSMLFQLGADGFAEPIWSPVRMNIYAFTRTVTGQFLVGTDEDGQLFEVSDLSHWSLLQNAPQGGEITSMLPVPGEDGAVYVITSNPAAVYKLSSQPVESGKFTSSPVDAQVAATWGKLRLYGSVPQNLPGVSWESRTGNSPTPDVTWSDWEGLSEHAISSPPGRYLQYRASFEQTDSVLRGVRLFYSYRNGAPIVSHINLVPVGLTIVTMPPKTNNVTISQLTSGKNGNSLKESPPVRQIRPLTEPGFFSAGWSSFDPNGDTLSYAVAIKALDADDWVTLGENLEMNVYSFNSRGMADGYYELRVTASDAPSNPGDDARTGMKLSQPFLVDNTNPTVRLGTQKQNEESYVLVYTATDALSIIADAKYVLDGGEPVQMIPEGGLFDSQEEIFRIVLSDLKPGPHSLVVDVADESGNRGVTQTVFSIETPVNE